MQIHQPAYLLIYGRIAPRGIESKLEIHVTNLQDRIRIVYLFCFHYDGGGVGNVCNFVGLHAFLI